MTGTPEPSATQAPNCIYSVAVIQNPSSCHCRSGDSQTRVVGCVYRQQRPDKEVTPARMTIVPPEVTWAFVTLFSTRDQLLHCCCGPCSAQCCSRTDNAHHLPSRCQSNDSYGTTLALKRRLGRICCLSCLWQTTERCRCHGYIAYYR